MRMIYESVAEGLAGIIQDKDKEIIELIKENKRFREALEFYASDISWQVDETHHSDVDKYKGDIARKALEGKQ